MENEVIQVQQADVLATLNRSEIDMQIATAKQYPRDVDAALRRIRTLATLDEEVADECFYALKRKDANGNDALIEGVSVRLAEIIAGAWGNLRVATRIIGNDGRMITAQAVCHDLETNLAISMEVSRSIQTKKGFTYSNDMQVVTGNAASAIAFRNAVLKVVGKAVTKKVVDDIKQHALSTITNLAEQRQKMFGYFEAKGVKKAQLLKYIGCKTENDVEKHHILTLRGLATAIKEGTTSIAESFQLAADSDRMAEEARAKAEEAQRKAAAAMGGNVDTETGEIKE